MIALREALRFPGTLRAVLAIILSFTAFSGAAPGERDPLFDPAPNAPVNCLCLQPDGRILAGGDFTAICGTSRSYFVRFNADDSLDTGFNPALPGRVVCTVLQADGKAIAGGLVAGPEGESRGFLRRVTAEGSLDNGYAAEIAGAWVEFGTTRYYFVGVAALAVQPDGAAIVGGTFSTINGQPRNSIARLLPDGTLDASFAPAVTHSTGQSSVYAVVVQPDGKILISGAFTAVNGASRYCLARLLPDGALDPAFSASPNALVNTMLVQPDGRIVLSGPFSSINGTNSPGVIRLNTDGTVDPGFTSPFTSSGPHITAMAQQADGKLFLAGGFSSPGRTGVARLLPNGNFDAAVLPGTFRLDVNTASGYTLALQADGRLLVGGNFNSLNGDPVKPLLRLVNDTATSQLSLSGAESLTWQRAGSQPEIMEAALDLTTDGGINWSSLGAGLYQAGAWRLNALNLPAAGEIRLRGRIGSVSAGMVEERRPFGGLSATMVVELPADTPRESGAAVDFGGMKVAIPALTKTVVLKNTGTAALSVTGFDRTGPHPAEFSADTTGLPEWLPPGSSATFLLRYHALFPGARTAALHLRSNDANRPLFTFNLSGTATPSDNADLASIGMHSSVSLSPAFDPEVYSYSATVAHVSTSIGITPRAAQGSATITVNGLPPGIFPLQSGMNSFTILVTAQDGITLKTYTLNVLRTPPVAGDVEVTFVPPEVWRRTQIGYFEDSVSRTAQLSDGSTLASGSFTLVDTVTRGPIAKFNSNGTLNTGFAPVLSGVDAYSVSVSCMAVLPNEKIFIGGSFTAVNSTGFGGFQRLNADGTLNAYPNRGVTGSVFRVLVQPDGKLLVSGSFTGGIARLHPTGARDVSFTFNPLGTFSGTGSPRLVALQPDGRVLCVATFSIQSYILDLLFRLNTDGSLDNTFAIEVHEVYSAAVQPDGKIIVGGKGQPANGSATALMKRLLTDGTEDPSFSASIITGPQVRYPEVRKVALQADGRILIAGDFDLVNGSPVRSFARLMPDGTLDTTFTGSTAGGTGSVSSISQQPDGMIVACGSFTKTGVLYRNGFAKLHNNPASGSMNVTADGTLTWMRGGAAPEVDCVTLELSTDGGHNWQDFGSASRVAGGWQKTGLPASGELRAMGRTQGPTSDLDTVESAFGTAPPAVTVKLDGAALPGQGATVDFGEVGVGSGNVSKTFTAGNTGGTSLQIRETALDGMAGADFEITTGIEGRRLFPGEQANLVIKCHPVSHGLRTATLRITSANPAVPAFTVLLKARGLPNANLSGLSLNGIALTPAFSENVTEYTTAAALLNPVSTVQVKATVSHSGASLSLNRQPLTSGVFSASINLATGVNTLPVVVTAADGITRKTYVITLTRSAPQGTLAELTLAGGTLNPPFNSEVTTYHVSVAAPVTSVKFTGRAAEPGGTVTAGGVPVTSLSLSGPVPLVPGLTLIPVVGTSADGTAKKTYMVEIVRLPPAPFGPDPAWSYPDVRTAFCTALQPDEKILTGGNGVTLYRNRADGAGDSTFSCPLAGNGVQSLKAILVQDDGKLVVAGDFGGIYGGVVRNYMARLNADGTIDQSYNPAPGSQVHAMARMPGNRVLIGGFFSSVGGVASRLALINAGGLLETAFQGQPNSAVVSIAVQPDGRILIGGIFTSVNGVPRNRFARLLPDGSLDTSFNPGANKAVTVLSVLPDGGILAGGEFTLIAGEAQTFLTRLTADGAMDPGWQFPIIEPGPVYTTVVQADGRLLVGGSIASVNGVQRNGLVRLLADGTLDVEFDAGFFKGSTVETLALQPDGSILAGGTLTYGGGLSAGGVVRLKNSAAAQQLTVSSPARIQWLRSGASPETQGVMFDLSTNGGVEWTSLGSGSRIAGGWELTGLTLPAGGHIRARARVAGGRNNASSGIAQTIVPFPLTPLEAWRQLHFSTVINTGIAANDFDADGDALSNLVEFAFSMNPRMADASLFPQPHRTGENMVLEFSHPPEADVMNYAAEWSSSMAAGSWQPVPEIRIGRYHKFSIPMLPGSRAFVRLNVNGP